MCSYENFLIWINWVLYLDSSLIGVWYVRKGSNLCPMMTWIFYPKLYLFIVDACLYLYWWQIVHIYTYTWWQIPHLYDLRNTNKWLKNEWTRKPLKILEWNRNNIYNFRKQHHFLLWYLEVHLWQLVKLTRNSVSKDRTLWWVEAALDSKTKLPKRGQNWINVKPYSTV